MTASTSKPSISTRTWIRFPPAAPSEPTDTLVLTSARYKVFVDIRWLKSADGTLPLHGAIALFSDLDWAFCGISCSVPSTSPTEPPSTNSRWLHWADSRDAFPGEYDSTWRNSNVDHEPMWQRARDKGVMTETPDGALEKGSMRDEETGRVTEYEELWDEVAPKGDGRVEGKVVSVVLVLEDERNGQFGAVVRVGQFVQGVIRRLGQFAAERWRQDENGEWVRVVKFGDEFVPCFWTQGGSVPLPDIGQKLTRDECEWTCIESDLFHPET